MCLLTHGQENLIKHRPGVSSVPLFPMALADQPSKFSAPARAVLPGNSGHPALLDAHGISPLTHSQNLFAAGFAHVGFCWEWLSRCSVEDRTVAGMAAVWAVSGTATVPSPWAEQMRPTLAEQPQGSLGTDSEVTNSAPLRCGPGWGCASHRPPDQARGLSAPRAILWVRLSTGQAAVPNSQHPAVATATAWPGPWSCRQQLGAAVGTAPGVRRGSFVVNATACQSHHCHQPMHRKLIHHEGKAEQPLTTEDTGTVNGCSAYSPRNHFLLYALICKRLH